MYLVHVIIILYDKNKTTYKNQRFFTEIYQNHKINNIKLNYIKILI